MFSLSFRLIWNDLRKNPRKYIMKLLILSILFSATTVTFLMPEAYRFLRIGPFEGAQYDISISGPFNTRNLSALTKQKEIDSLVGLSNWGGLRIMNIQNSRTVNSTTWFADDMKKAGILLPNNETILMKGSFQPDSAVVSARVADYLGITVGDHIRIGWENYELNDGIEYVISGILYESSYGAIVIADYRPYKHVIYKATEKVSSSNKPAYYTSIYINLNNDVHIKNLDSWISSIIGFTNFTTEWRTARINSENEEFERFAAGTIKNQRVNLLIIYMVIVLTLFILILRRDRKLYTILYACGVPIRFFYTHFFTKAFSILCIVTAFSLWLAYLYFTKMHFYYFPGNSWLNLIGFAVLIDLIALLLVLVMGFQYIRKYSIAYSLNREEGL